MQPRQQQPEVEFSHCFQIIFPPQFRRAHPGGGLSSCITVRGYDLVESTLLAAFEPFGDIVDMQIDDRHK